jgi:hypothetical protein
MHSGSEKVENEGRMDRRTDGRFSTRIKTLKCKKWSSSGPGEVLLQSDSEKKLQPNFADMFL